MGTRLLLSRASIAVLVLLANVLSTNTEAGEVSQSIQDFTSLAWESGQRGNKEQGEKLVKEAEALDKYYSKASAIPDSDLFVKPEVEPHNHTYLFQPF
ncbi:MAG: hypothetical protein ABIJ12_02705 [bacterium]